MSKEIRINEQCSYNPKKCILKAAFNCDIYEGTFTRTFLKEKQTIKCAVKVIRSEYLDIASESSTNREHTSSTNVDKELLTRRELQALLCQEQTNENIIRFYDAPEVDETIFLIMERFDCSLHHLIQPKGNDNTKLNPPCELTKKEILRQATEGVRYLHSLGVLHRNLSSSNIVIARYWNRNGDDVDRDVVKITDFALSKRMKHYLNDVSNSNRLVDEGWTAPEIISGSNKISFPVDIFSLGCIFYFVMEGSHPFGSPVSRILNIKAGKPNLIQNTDQLIRKMIDINPEIRPTIDQIIDDAFLKQGEFYTLYDGKNTPGLCIIINQMVFENQAMNRDGSDKDRDKLSHMFSSFGYDVEIHENLKKSDFENTIEGYSKRNYCNYLSIVVCIMSHGDDGVIFGVDLKPIEIQKVKDAFNSNKCPSLDGKPKMFIIQACRGNSKQKATPSGNPAVADFVDIGATNLKPGDSLDIRATVPGFESYRLNKTGSLLVSHLVESLTKDANLQEACIATKNKLAKFERVKQMPEEISSLRKNIRFRTGYGKGVVRFVNK